jgi:hypothetical protein
MPTRFSEWYQRSHFTAASRAGLGRGAELWNPDPTHYEGWSELQNRLVALGRKPTRRMLVFYLQDHLLDDVLVAAGGVEKAVGRFRSAVADLERWVAEQGIQATPGVPGGVSHPAAIDAWYAFADVISWARALADRVQRRPLRRRDDPQGLLPAIKAARLRKRVAALFDDLCRGPVGETRTLANFTLHAALVRHPLSGAALETSGVVRLPLPDPLAPGVPAVWRLLTWQQNRNAVTFTEDLWVAVQEFIDALLAAFEKAVPKRLREPPASAAGLPAPLGQQRAHLVRVAARVRGEPGRRQHRVKRLTADPAQCKIVSG